MLIFDLLFFFLFLIIWRRRHTDNFGIEIERLVELLCLCIDIRDASILVIFSSILCARRLSNLEFIDLSNVAININQANLFTLASFGRGATPYLISGLGLSVLLNNRGCRLFRRCCKGFRVTNNNSRVRICCGWCIWIRPCIGEIHVNLLRWDHWTLMRSHEVRSTRLSWFPQHPHRFLVFILLWIERVVSHSELCWRRVHHAARSGLCRLNLRVPQPAVTEQEYGAIAPSHIIYGDVRIGRLIPGVCKLTMLLLPTENLLLPTRDFVPWL